MRWLLQAAVQSGAVSIGANKHVAGIANRVSSGASDFMQSASDLASSVASDIGSEVAANAAGRARSTATLDSATALPANSGNAIDVDESSDQHLNEPHSAWHGHGTFLLILVGVHLAAFFYWLYLYLVNRKFENRKSAELARRVFHKFQVTYEWATMPRRKPTASPAASPRMGQAVASHNATLTRSSSGFKLNKLIKGAAP